MGLMPDPPPAPETEYGPSTALICNATVYEVQLIRAVAAERNCSLNMSIGSIATGAT
jgi:hypothetical protein